MMWLLWLIVSTAGLFWGTCILFIAVMQCKTLYDRDELTLFWKIIIIPAAVVGITMDCLFNVVFGTIVFRELPREWLFSHRVYRHWNVAPWKEQKRNVAIAQFFVTNLNLIDPGHVWRD